MKLAKKLKLAKLKLTMKPALLLAAAFLLLPAAARAQGAIIETMEDLKNRPEPQGFRGALPAQVSLAATLPPPGNQNPTGSCVSWAATYAAASQAARRAGLGPSVRLSPSFTYNQMSRDPYCRLGTTASKTLDLLRDVGVLPIEEYAFDGGWCGRLPNAAELQRAAKYKIKGWSRFDATNIEAVKAQLARGVPVIFDTRTNADFKALKSDAVFDAPGAMNGGGHTMIAVGYDDARQAIRIQNSWGRKWADGGYAWLSYNFWTHNVHVGYVID
ncbi:Papain family cysteine protease [Rhizobiales bacterium GAS191]|nr:Papain family cysteine protease [Rhizobiales bacterium GAS191]